MTKHPEPFPSFPLTAHRNGQWCKKIRGKVHYFGSVKNGWQAALEKYEQEKVSLYAGRKPEREPTQLRDILNAFHKRKEEQRDRGDLAARTFDEYKFVMDAIADTFGNARPVDSIGSGDLPPLSVVARNRGSPQRGHQRADNRAGVRHEVRKPLVLGNGKGSPYLRRVPQGGPVRQRRRVILLVA